MPEPEYAPEPTDEQVAQSTALGDQHFEFLLNAALGYENTDDAQRYDSAAILFSVWVNLTRYLAGVNGWTAEELHAEIAHHVGVVRAN